MLSAPINVPVRGENVWLNDYTSLCSAGHCVLQLVAAELKQGESLSLNLEQPETR